MTHEDAQEMREEAGICPSCGEHKERGRECLCCGWVKAPPDYAVKCDVVEVEASSPVKRYRGVIRYDPSEYGCGPFIEYVEDKSGPAVDYSDYANMAKEAERWRKEADRMRPVYEAAMAVVARHDGPGDPAYIDQCWEWKRLVRRARAAREAEGDAK